MKRFPVLLTILLCLLLSVDSWAQTQGWGYNLRGQLGIGNNEGQPLPITVNVPDATGIGGGGNSHTLFLRANGTLLAAGYNGVGNLGDGTTVDRTTPVAVLNLANVIQASAGDIHSVALLADGTVWSWGRNDRGQLGNGTVTDSTTPIQSSISGVVQIDAGHSHTLALKADGTVWAWGWNANGQLGNNGTFPNVTPQPVPGLSGIIAVSAGQDHSIALKADGTVWIWGRNSEGQLGNGIAGANQLTPVQNTTLSNVVQISAGGLHNIALLKDGTVRVWGFGGWGLVGNGTMGGDQLTPAQTLGITTAVEIEAGEVNNFVRLRDGSVRAWGINYYGEVGNGTTNTEGCWCQPFPVTTSVGMGNTGIAAGRIHAFALKPVIAATTGTNWIFRGDNLRLTFSSITSAGNVSYTAVDPSAVATSYTIPAGYFIQRNQPAYDVTTTTTYSGNIDVCIAGINEFNATNFANLKILHGEGANWVDRTLSSNFRTRQICARVTSLSPFVIANTSLPTAFDFDGDGKTDIATFRPSVGEWWINRSSNATVYALPFGSSSDKLTPVDFTGDGKSDIAFFRPATGEWFVLRSENNSFYSFPFGTNGDIPAPADFDGDNKTDAAVLRPSNSTWYIRRSSDGGTTIQSFGQNGDVPVVADYDGDGKSDIAIYRAASGEWWINRSTAGLIAFQFGNSTDKPVQGDYTGDGKADVALFRPSTGEWFVLRSENQSYYSFPFGANGDIPAPGDYDGDGKADAAVFRPSASTWYAQRATAGTLIQSFGQAGDKPVPNVFVP